MLIDSHAHLDDSRFYEDRELVVERAWNAGVRMILTIGNGTGPDDMGCGIPLTENYNWIYTSVGIHPHDASKAEERHFGLMEKLSMQKGVVAIGEAGLDYYYDNSPRNVQREVFRRQLKLANRISLPIIIHARDADDDTVNILRDEAPLCGVLHCFTGGDKLVDCALDLGLKISFSGIVTFKGSETLREIVKRVPRESILCETDAPYLAPVPHRGKRNEPAYVAETALTLAEIRGVPVEVLETDIQRNFLELFGVA